MRGRLLAFTALAVVLSLIPRRSASGQSPSSPPSTGAVTRHLVSLRGARTIQCESCDRSDGEALLVFVPLAGPLLTAANRSGLSAGDWTFFSVWSAVEAIGTTRLIIGFVGEDVPAHYSSDGRVIVGLAPTIVRQAGGLAPAMVLNARSEARSPVGRGCLRTIPVSKRGRRSSGTRTWTRRPRVRAAHEQVPNAASSAVQPVSSHNAAPVRAFRQS
jgi:hypothetical protein